LNPYRIDVRYSQVLNPYRIDVRY